MVTNSKKNEDFFILDSIVLNSRFASFLSSCLSLVSKAFFPGSEIPQGRRNKEERTPDLEVFFA